MGVLKIKDGNQWTSINTIKGAKGDKGDQGNAGVGVPSGGTAGQVLKKSSATNYDTEWADAGTSLPSGGTQGQVLIKNSSTDGDVEWGDSVCMITLTATTENDTTTYSIDKDMADVLAAHQAGKPVMAKAIDQYDTWHYYRLHAVSPIISQPIGGGESTQSGWSFGFIDPSVTSNNKVSNTIYQINYNTGSNSISIIKTDVSHNIVKDVKIGNTSLVSSGTATIPSASPTTNGYMPSNVYKKVNGTNVCYCTCSSAASDSIKELVPINYDANDSVPNGAGSVFFVKFDNTNTASNVSFEWYNDGFNTGLGYVYYDGARITSSNAEYGGVADRVAMYMIDEDNNVQWICWASDTSSGGGTGAAVIYATTDTAAATTTKVLTANNVPNELVDGTILVLQSTYTNSAAPVYFKFDGDSSQIQVTSFGSSITSQIADLVTKGTKAQTFVLRTTGNTKYWYVLESFASGTTAGIMPKDLYTKMVSYTNVLYGTCSTAAATAEKEIVVNNPRGVSLSSGTVLFVKPTQTNTASNPKFKLKQYGVNATSQITSSAASVYYNNSAIVSSANYSRAGNSSRWQMYVYLNSGWHWMGQSYDENTDTTYTALPQSEVDTGTSTTGGLISAKVLRDSIDKNQKVKILPVTEEQSVSGDRLQLAMYPSYLYSLMGDQAFVVDYYSVGEYPARVCYEEEYDENLQETLYKIVVSFEKYDESTGRYETYSLSSYLDEEDPENEQEFFGNVTPIHVTQDAGEVPYDNTETYSAGTIGKAVKDLEGSVETLEDGLTFIKYGISTWNDFITAFTNNNVVYCRASSNSNPATGSQNRLAFMAYVNSDDPASITNVEFQYYRSVNSHSATQQGDQTYVYKLDKTAGWTVTVRENYTKIVAGTGLTSSYSNGVLTISLA